ncbi:hypothetical protein KIPB_013535, partial [Kipferlia bialata]
AKGAEAKAKAAFITSLVTGSLTVIGVIVAIVLLLTSSPAPTPTPAPTTLVLDSNCPAVPPSPVPNTTSDVGPCWIPNVPPRT